MRIAILNNAANYLDFNVNLAKYLELFNHTVVFLNTDKFIRRQLIKYNLLVEEYPRINSNETEHYYTKDSDIIRYFKRIYHIGNTNELIRKKNKEYATCKNYFLKNKFDYVLILNGSFNVETDVCRELGIKCFFFEHGYFPNTIQMDRKGVNCNAEFGNLSLNEFLAFYYNSTSFEPKDFTLYQVRYKLLERYILRLLDPQYNSFFAKFIKRKRNLTAANKRFQKFNVDHLTPEQAGEYILFPLQVNSDTQIILNSSFSSMYEAIEKVLPKLKATGLKIIIKEHPMEVEPVDYSDFIDNKQVFLVKKVDLDHFIEQSRFVVNINSSVGLQAIAKYKKVLTLGDAFYNSGPTTIVYEKVENNNLLKAIDSLKVDKAKVDEYINHFMEHIFIKGHFYTPSVDFLERIRNRLV